MQSMVSHFEEHERPIHVVLIVAQAPLNRRLPDVDIIE